MSETRDGAYAGILLATAGMVAAAGSVMFAENIAALPNKPPAVERLITEIEEFDPRAELDKLIGTTAGVALGAVSVRFAINAYYDAAEQRNPS